MDQYIGKMLDNRYEILECIGRGGMAEVYKARCHRLNRLVAVKILKPELANDADFRRRFHDESQAVAMLSHTNIVSVYDVSHSDGLDYIVMELINGMTLKQYMQKRGEPLNWREALHFITQIVRALGHAHSRGIIHRDIKPHNILVLRDGSVKVADFGIARLASAAQTTLTQEALGSVHYISPEQAKGSHVDGRSDLYSAGVVLYEMLTGRLPFEGETPVFVAIQHINSIPIPPRELNPDIPAALERIVLKAMAPNPDQRYASAEEMLADLKEFRKNPGVIVTESGKEQEPEFVDEPTMVVSLGSLPAAESSAQKSSERESASDEKPGSDREIKNGKSRRSERVQKEGEETERPRRKGVPPILIAILAILLFVGGIIYFLYTFLIQGMFAEVQEYQVPDLRGYTMEELGNMPSVYEGFKLEIGATVFSADYEEGQICEQNPAPESTVREGNKTIVVNISGGEDNDYMIDVTGWDARRALNTLQNEMKLSVKQEYEYSPTITAGYVISYTPMEGSLVKPGDEVTIVISRGPEVETINVPDFLNVDINRVKSQLESLGLEMGKVDYFPSDEYKKDRVIWQSISANTEVDVDTVINFQVSSGPENTPPPETDSPTESEDIVPPTADVNVPTSTKTITVNLTGYSGTVAVRILVGTTTLFDGTVNSDMGFLTREVTASGQQIVTIYINGIVADTYMLEF